MWLVTARMTKQKWEDQQTTVLGRDGERPDVTNMSNHKKAGHSGWTEWRRWGTSAVTRNRSLVNCQWKCTHTMRLNEAYSSSFAQWCAFPQVAEMLTQPLSLSWPGMWGFLCRAFWVTNAPPSESHFPSTSSLTNSQICRYKCAKLQWRGPVKGLWCVLSSSDIANRRKR